MNYDNTLKGHKNEQAIRELLAEWTDHLDHTDHSNRHMVSESTGTYHGHGTLDVEHSQYDVAKTARWSSEADTLWGDDAPAYLSNVAVPAKGFDSLKLAEHEQRVINAADKAAHPYLYNKAGTKPKYDGRQSANAMKAARKRIAETVVKVEEQVEPMPTTYAEARRDDMAVQPRKHTLRDAQTGVLALTGWDCAPVSFEGMGEQVYVSGHDKAALVTQLANEVRGAMGDGHGLSFQPCTPAASWESPVAHWNDDDAAVCIAAYLERTEA